MIKEVIETYGTQVSRMDLMSIANKYGINPVFMTNNKIDRGLYDISEFAVVAEAQPKKVELSDEDILNSQRRRFRTLSRMTEGVISDTVRSMIVSGPAGIGKTYTIEGILESAANNDKIKFTAISGFVRATGLFRLLWENRHENNVILLDDADSAFQDEISLNLLKAALDSTKRREISWRSEKEFEDESGEGIPNTFEFRGSIIFITNVNFESLIHQGNKLAPHFAALISRSYYIDLNFNSPKEYLLRIKDVLESTNMATSIGLSNRQSDKLMTFIEQHYLRLRELSLRMVQKLAKIMIFTKNDEDFLDVVETTCFKSR